MKLKAEYRRETYRNYVLLDNEEDNIKEAKRKELYEIPMLLNNKIPYLLDVQITYLNERARYAYDITSNQTISDWVERRKIKSKDCEQLYSSVFGAINSCCDYLLDEKKLVLCPEYIYYDLGKSRYRFIYHVHYYRDLLQQINKLSEFLMDHIDYEDERAVLLVYAIYHESKKKETSIDTLISVFEEKSKVKEDKNLERLQNLDENFELHRSQKLDEDQYLSRNQKTDEIERTGAYAIIDKNNLDKEREKNKKEGTQVVQWRDYKYTEKEKMVGLTRKQLINPPIMESRQESEKLISKYPTLSYSVVLVSLLVMLIVIVYAVVQGLEADKLVAVILIVTSITAYIGSKMFDPKKKVEKMVPVVEYIKQPMINTLNHSEDSTDMINNKENYIKEKTQVKKIEIKEMEPNEIQDKGTEVIEDDLNECTQLLSIVERGNNIDHNLENEELSTITGVKTKYVLIPEDNKYNKLRMLEFPFYIGKITDGMDAVIMESTISRVHAKITWEDENLYITDMGSTNGTYVNEDIIQPHTRIQIRIGDILRFANISYTLSIM